MEPKRKHVFILVLAHRLVDTSGYKGRSTEEHKAFSTPTDFMLELDATSNSQLFSLISKHSEKVLNSTGAITGSKNNFLIYFLLLIVAKSNHRLFLCCSLVHFYFSSNYVRTFIFARCFFNAYK